MGMKKFLLFAIFLVSLSFLISNAKAITYISGCSNLNQEGETYYLTQDIIDYPDTCMSVSASYVTLDCQGHIIDGIGNGVGFYINQALSGVNIKNCVLSDWSTGIYSYYLNPHLLQHPFPICGNGVCEFGEGFLPCPEDCPPGFPSRPPVRCCGNGICEFGEEEGGCPEDCPPGVPPQPPVGCCGNGICEFGEGFLPCPEDCPPGVPSRPPVGYCGNGICEIGEGHTNCPQDCPLEPQSLFTNIVFKNNTYGLHLIFSMSVTISDSKFQNNSYGIYFEYGYEGWSNLVYNNLFNNTYGDFISWGDVIWNTTRQIGKRIYSAGTEIGGNYWTNPAGNGYSDTCTDNDKDGFCDSPYDTGVGIDYLPLSDEYAPPNLPPEITIFSPLNQSYYGSIDFAFKAVDDLDENFMIRAYLNNELDYKNTSYQNDTQISYSKFLPMGTYNFTVYAEDSYGASSKQEVIFTSLGYCGDSICQADYENSANCFKDCGETARQFTVGMGSIVLAFGGLMLLATAFASSPTEGKDYIFKIFIAVIGIILMVYGIIYLFNL